MFDDLSDQLALDVLEHPLSGQGFDVDTVMGKWVRIAGALAIAATSHRPRRIQSGARDGPTLADGYGLDPVAARLRAAQIVAAALGWRIFEDYLIEAGELEAVPVETFAPNWLARRAARRDAMAFATGPERPHTSKPSVPRARDLRPWVSARPIDLNVYIRAS